MRVLVLTAHLPLPPFSGGRRRELELLRRVSDSVDVELVSITKTPDEDVRHLAEARALFGEVTLLPARPGDGPAAPQERRHRCPRAAAHIQAALRGADIVHAEGFYLLQHLPRDADVPVLLGTQNVEHVLLQRRARLVRTGRERAARVWDAEVTRRAELAAWRQVALLAAVTANDAAVIRAAVPSVSVEVVPDGSDHRSAHGDDQAGPTPATERPRLVMVGNYAYTPNVDAARWLVRDIAPRIAATVPDLEIVLVGNAPPPEVQELHDGDRVVVTGRVPAVEPWLRSADVVACPLRFGGGIKVKVLEALAAGCAVVGTPVAAEGLGTGSAEAMRVVADAGDFAARSADLLRRTGERARLRAAARAFANGLPTWDDAAEALLACYERLAPRTQAVRL